MKKALVICDHAQGTLRQSTLELLSSLMDSPMEKIAFATHSGADKLGGSVGGYGIKKLFYDSSDKLNSASAGQMISELCKNEGVDFILATSSSFNREFLPRVAIQLGAGLVSDCTELVLGAEPTIRRPMYAGKCSAKVKFEGTHPKIVLMRPNQLPIKTVAAGSCEAIALKESASGLGLLVKEIVQGTSKKLDLTEAPIIVSGGRGLKGPEGFKMLEDLAEVLGASVGASRAVCDAGWMPHSMQVGQTGKTVAPNLYIAVAISGAIQHLAGMSGSRVIVAINSDANAPIFQKATYGIVGDAFHVVPLLTQEFKKILK